METKGEMIDRQRELRALEQIADALIVLACDASAPIETAEIELRQGAMNRLVSRRRPGAG